MTIKILAIKELHATISADDLYGSCPKVSAASAARLNPLPVVDVMITGIKYSTAAVSIIGSPIIIHDRRTLFPPTVIIETFPIPSGPFLYVTIDIKYFFDPRKGRRVGARL
jgi:hypothetical protein